MPAEDHRATSYTLVGSDGQDHPGPQPGTLGGHRTGGIYGRLDCRAALRALANGGYAADRVFFADEATAVAAGFRPCGVCLPEPYATWKDLRDRQSDPAALRAAYTASRRLQDRFGPLHQMGSLIIGHSRDQTTRDAAQLLISFLDSRGVEVRDVVDWPDSAASWLRQANRFIATAPDLWVALISHEHGWTQMRQRLRNSDWDPDRTLVIATDLNCTNP